MQALYEEAFGHNNWLINTILILLKLSVFIN